MLSRFRRDFFGCLRARSDALFELSEALLCTDGAVRSLVELSEVSRLLCRLHVGHDSGMPSLRAA